MPVSHRVPVVVAVFAAAFFLIASSAQAATTLKKGNLTGAGGHYATGGVEVVRDGGTIKVIIKGNFRTGRYPDPKVAFGRNGYKADTIIGRLKKPRGAQTYVVPSRIKLDNYNQLWIWCEQFNVPIGVARLR